MEQNLRGLNESLKGKKCKGIEGIIDEGEDMMDEDAPDSVADAALIAAAQRVEHCEIAAYGTVRRYARRLGFQDQAELLNQTLREEDETDKKLTSLAESSINEEAKTARQIRNADRMRNCSAAPRPVIPFWKPRSKARCVTIL